MSRKGAKRNKRRQSNIRPGGRLYKHRRPPTSNNSR